MDDQAVDSRGAGPNELDGEIRLYKRDFWETETLKFAEPHFRLRKVARVVRQAARGRGDCDLLDLGCGPAALARLMPPGVRYHGIDIAIPEPGPNLMEMDLTESPISFRGKKFDIIVAQGLFEYLGNCQSRKFAEIASLLNDGGTFIVTYENFAHRQRSIYWPYSNVRQPEDFRRDLSRFFRVERRFPGAHNWNHSHPRKKLVAAPQARLNVSIPVISRRLAVDYFYICSPLRTGR
jgi:SAM-dependent methyltransferase